MTIPFVLVPAATWRWLRTVLAAVLLATVFPLALTAQSSRENARREFDIPAGDASATLKRFTAQSGEQLVFSTDEVEGVKTNAVRGVFDQREALARLLEGTPLSATQDDKTGALAVGRKDAPEKNVASRPLGERTADGGLLKLEKYEVTGSRIRGLLGEATAQPLVTWTSEDFERSGFTTLGEFRNMIPQLGVTSGVGGTGLTGGAISFATQARVNFDLRGLGNNTTLVLVDGRRMARGGQSVGVDAFNPDAIPLSMIDRIEILPSGASALYGADAIGGVVNIILKKNFTGTEVSLSYDNSFENDVAFKTVSLKTGYRAGRLSLVASASYSENNEMKQSDRWFLRPENRGTFGASLLNTPPAGAGSIRARTGVLPGIGASTSAIPPGANGMATTVADFQNAGPIPPRFALSEVYSVINPAERITGFVRASYDLRTSAQLFLDANWSQAVTTFTDRPVQMNNFNIPAGYRGNPFGVPVQISKIFFDLPRSLRESTNRNRSVTLGVRGDLPRDWHYEFAGSWARSTLTDYYPNGVGQTFNAAKMAAAMANPNVAERPILIYDSTAGNPNPPGFLESLTNVRPSRDVSDSFLYNLQADGPVWQLPAGEIGVAAGVEWRRDTVDFLTDPTNTFMLQESPVRTVKSVFAEVKIPLLSSRQDIPFVHELELNLAGRIDDHNDFGRAETPRVAGLYRPAKWLAVRASRSEGFKAPTLFALYAPQSTFDQLFSATNPLFDTVRNEFVEGFIPVTTGGDPTLRAEHSVSYNWGVVFDVPFVQGLSFSVDHYDIDYREKVEDLSFVPHLLLAYPDRLIREPASGGIPGRIIGIDGRSVNTSTTRTRGFDYQATYRRTTPWGRFIVKAQMTKPDLYEYATTPDRAPARLNYPARLSGTATWVARAWDVSVAMQQQAEYRIDESQTYTAPSKIEWTPTIGYDFGRDPRFRASSENWYARLLAGTKISVAVPNVFNAGPSVQDAITSFVSVHDQRLRRYVISVRRQF